MQSVVDLVHEIANTRTQQSASRRDEVAVMQAMMNDMEFKVTVLDKPAEPEYYCPAEDLRRALADQIHKTTKMPASEATALANDYEYSKSDATTQVAVSKEFVNVYMDTGRKLPLGCREHSNVSLVQKKIEACQRTYPKKVGINDDGTDRYERAVTDVPAHNSIKVMSSCPPTAQK